MTGAIYDKIGVTYDTTRCADPGLTDAIIQHLQPVANGSYLDLACGSGNYTQALFNKGVNICGLDISETMLEKARAKAPYITWQHGSAMELPFINDYFAGVVCTLATHHMSDLQRVFQEVYRVINNGRFIIFTMTPEILVNWWLPHYFPNMIAQAKEKLSTTAQFTQLLKTAGFKTINIEPFYIKEDIQDLFLYAAKHRPELFLQEAVRAGMSGFALAKDQDEIRKGCEQLKRDIETQEIKKVLASYADKDQNACLFIIAEK